VNIGAQLAEALTRGGRLIIPQAPERPIIRCLTSDAKRALAPLLNPTIRRQAQALMARVADYRTTLLSLFRLNADGTEVDGDQARHLVAEEMRLSDDLGPALADAVRAQVAAEYVESTGRCPLCGGSPHA
jgi:hypothetical protein